MHGTGDQWFDVYEDAVAVGVPALAGDGARSEKPPKGGTPTVGGTSAKTSRRLLFRFQYKGLYPALDEATRLSPGFRGRLEHLIDEVEMRRVCGKPAAGRCRCGTAPWAHDR